MQEPKNQMLGTMVPPVQLKVLNWFVQDSFFVNTS